MTRILLIVHGIITMAAAVVLAVLPAAIPATVGISIDVEGWLLSYFLAAAELAIALLSLGAVRLGNAAALRLIFDVFIVFHLSTAALEVLYLALTEVTPVLVANVAIRLVASALFLIARRTLRERPAQ